MLKAGAALVLLALAGCGMQQSRRDDQVMAALQARLPGRYDNGAQVRSDAQSGAAQAHPAVSLLIMPANAAFIGKTVYFVRENETGDPRHVLSESIWVLGRTTDVHGKQQQQIEQHVYLFKEPQRWVNAGEQPELLESMLPQDLQQLPGCELIWTRRDADYIAQRPSNGCSPVTKSEGMMLEQRLELHENELAVQQQQMGAEGLLDVTDVHADPFLRFVRRGAAN